MSSNVETVAATASTHWRYLVVAVMLLLLAALGLWKLNTRATLVTVDAELPHNFPAEGFDHDSFEQLLSRFVVDGRVDYPGWHGDAAARKRLDSYLAALAAYSPDSHPERFRKHNAALAYWMYAYNAFVIKAIVDRWPLARVTDVKAPVEVVRGLGFFYTLAFVVGGEPITLYDLEHNKIIKRTSDPRVHFVLNCGSGGCPAIRPKLPTGEALETLLQQAAADFVNEPRNVVVDHEHREIRLSQIFEWYEDEFVNDVRRRRLPTSQGPVAWVRLVAGKRLLAELNKAADYEVRYVPYAWEVNSAH